jgi:hypothetical protein
MIAVSMAGPNRNPDFGKTSAMENVVDLIRLFLVGGQLPLIDRFESVCLFPL